MSDWEEKLNSILGSPENMAKIMEMARSLGLGGDKAPEPEPEPEPDPGPGLDPKMLSMLTRLMGEFRNSNGSEQAAVLSALKPYLKPDRGEKIDRALKIARLAKVAKIAFAEFGDAGIF